MDVSERLAADIVRLTVDGGDGNDQIAGSPGNDVLIGGAGNDFIDGGPGNDAVSLGAGDDTFRWDPGDGSDTVDGRAGQRQQCVFNGSDAAENFDVSANGSHVRLTRDVGNVDDGLQRRRADQPEPPGGADTVTVNDLTGTDVNRLNLDLSGAKAQASVTARPTLSSSMARTVTTPSTFWLPRTTLSSQSRAWCPR